MVACHLHRLSAVALGQIILQATADPPWRGDSEENCCLHFGAVGVTIACCLQQLSEVALGRIPKAGADPP